MFLCVKYIANKSTPPSCSLLPGVIYTGHIKKFRQLAVTLNGQSDLDFSMDFNKFFKELKHSIGGFLNGTR